MKKVRIIFLVVILGIVGVVIFQNQDFFMSTQSLVINLYFAEYAIPETNNLVFFLACFFIGLLIGYFYFLFIRIKLNKTNKNLKSTINAHLETISDLEKDVESIKRSFPETGNDDVQENLNSENT